MPPPNVPPSWPKLFLHHLAIKGSVIAAAEAAGVNVTSAYNRRQRHADFKAEWDKVLGEREARARGVGASGPPGDWRRADGGGDAGEPMNHEVPSAPGTSASGSGDAGAALVPRAAAGKAALMPAGPGRWSAGAEERFLIELSASASVKRAAEAAGFSETAVYRRRYKEARFRAAWDAAIETGKARVQALLVEAATGTFDPDSMPVAEHVPKVSVAEAINIAKMNNGGKKAEPTDWRADQAELQQEYAEAAERILMRLKRLRARDDAEKSAANWTRDEENDCWVPPGWVRAG